MIAARYPGYERGMQALTSCGPKPADTIQIKTREGRALDVTFDISAYFGKF